METNEAYCHVVARVLAADGKMDENERAFLEATFDKMGLDEDAKDRVRHFESGAGDEVSVKLWDPLEIVKQMPLEERQALRDDLVGATLADGKIDELEKVLMEVLSETLDV